MPPTATFYSQSEKSVLNVKKQMFLRGNNLIPTFPVDFMVISLYLSVYFVNYFYINILRILQKLLSNIQFR